MKRLPAIAAGLAGLLAAPAWAAVQSPASSTETAAAIAAAVVVEQVATGEPGRRLALSIWNPPAADGPLANRVRRGTEQP